MPLRLTDQRALELWESPLQRLCQEAHEFRCRFYPDKKASYIIMRIVSYTNVCVADCSYCAFYRRPGNVEGYVLTEEEIFKKIDHLLAVGGSLVAMEGGFNPKLKIDHYERLFRAVRKKYGDRVEIYGPTIVEVIFIAKASRISPEEALVRLKESGLRWIPGGGAEILTDEWRKKLSPKKYSVKEYLGGIELAQRLGFGTTATMVIGFGESPKDRIEHLRHIRDLQEKTGGFSSFLLWSYQPDNTVLGGIRAENDDYLRMVAISRLYLGNIPVIRASVLTQGEGVAQALLSGAHDFDIPIEDQVTELAGARIERNVEKVLGWVRAAGVEPVKRSPLPHPCPNISINALTEKTALPRPGSP
ncbi:MAG: radical SAM protein [Deltaproteobacteria bacterium]|nr:radical SAM protein [Deltaproteobacteria bacterium]MBI4374088.1 radical SAM protein [Deltaproteobacteria bacterium]